MLLSFNKKSKTSTLSITFEIILEEVILFLLKVIISFPDSIYSLKSSLEKVSIGILLSDFKISLMFSKVLKSFLLWSPLQNQTL